MIKLHLSLKNPWVNKKPGFHWCKNATLSKYKALEIEIWQGAIQNNLGSLDIDTAWRGQDHAGPSLQVEFLGFKFHIKMYDIRNWNYQKGTWETRANYLNTKPGDKIIFRASGPHWFTDRIENAKKLQSGNTYTIKSIAVASSSTAVQLEETGDLEFELMWFDI